jgi:F0F1-type ATP synthase assembly protein I
VEELSARRDLYQGFGNALGQAVEMVGAPLLFGLLGFLLDRWLGWFPVLTVILSLYGLIGGMLRAYYAYIAKMAKDQEGKPWSKGGEGGDGADREMKGA